MGLRHLGEIGTRIDLGLQLGGFFLCLDEDVRRVPFGAATKLCELAFIERTQGLFCHIGLGGRIEGHTGKIAGDLVVEPSWVSRLNVSGSDCAKAFCWIS